MYFISILANNNCRILVEYQDAISLISNQYYCDYIMIFNIKLIDIYDIY